MRADRLLSIMLLLQVYQRMTARELAKRLEVSERTIHRDMDALSGAGIPVFAERGSGGGWMMQGKYQTNLTGLNEVEIQALFLSQSTHVLADLGLNQASEAAFIKLLAALPSLSRRDAEYARQRIHVDGAGWFQARKESVPALPLLQEALWQERKLLFTYERGDTTVERLADPLGLVAKRSVWYLVACVEGELRSYRVSRIQEVRLTEQLCVRPADFDLASYWERSTASFKAHLPCYTARVRVAPEVLARVRGYTRVEWEEAADGEGWVQFSLQFDVEDEACTYALGLSPWVEVVEPQGLRRIVIQRAEATVSRYKKWVVDDQSQI